MIKQIQQAILFDTIDELPIASVIQALIQCDDAYFNDEELLDDHQYDAIKLYAQRIAPTDPYFIGVGSAVRGGKVKLPNPMGSLDQIYQGDFVKWVEKHNLHGNDIVISDKLDGTSCQLIYNSLGELQIAFSRGDGTFGADVFRHVSKIHNVPKQISATNGVAIRAEIIITPANFEKIKNQVTSKSGRIYRNPRNFVAGRMNASEGQNIVYSNLDLVAYEIIGSPLSKSEQFEQLNEWGFKTARWDIWEVKGTEDSDLIDCLMQQRRTSEYEIDGLVIEVNDSKTRAQLNPTKDTLNPAFAVKFKIADASNYAEPLVTGVTWAISKDGYFKPTVQIQPTELAGVTIQNCTGFNAKFIQYNQVGPGARIALIRSGDVIPFIQSVLSPSPTGAQMPTESDVHWTETGVDLVLNNANANATVQFEQLNDFFATLDIPNLGEGNLQKIFDCGFTTPESIICLTQEDIGDMIGSPVTGKKIFKGMREKLTNIPIYTLMGAHPALGRGIGTRKVKKLWEAFCGDMSNCTDINKIVAVDGFDTKSATKVANGYGQFLDFYEQIKKYVTLTEYVAPATGKLSGMNICFTGYRSKELESTIESLGGKIASGVSNKTTHLTTNDPTSATGKAQKARELGIPILTEPQLRAML